METSTWFSFLSSLIVLFVFSPKESFAIDFRPTYPDSCPLGVDYDGRRSRLCLPKWKPTYNMSLSTIIMPCNNSGYYNSSVAAKYGIADFDWSNAKAQWANAQPMDCEERLVHQAQIIKKINPNTKVWVYRNLVKALPWYTSVREKLCDPRYEGWFLKFDPKVTPHVPKCDEDYDPPKCSEFYHDQEQTPHHPSGDGSCKEPCDCGCVPCGEYLWDHRNQSLRDWLANVHSTGNTSVDNPAIDGIFIDDEWLDGKPTEVDGHIVEDCGLSKADTDAMTGNWTLNMKAAQQAALDKNGFSWRLFSPGTFTGGWGFNKNRCLHDLRTHCVKNDTLQHSAMMMNEGGENDFEQTLAVFLLLRGPYAWFGYPWKGCGHPPPSRPAALDMDYGSPIDFCNETKKGSGIFQRNWTKALVQLDCNTWKATISPHIMDV